MQRQFLRTGVVLGSFKLDVATIMNQAGLLRNCQILGKKNIKVMQ